MDVALINEDHCLALSNHITSSLLEPGHLCVQAKPLFAVQWYRNMCSIFVTLCDSIFNIVSAALLYSAGGRGGGRGSTHSVQSQHQQPCL